MAIVGIDLGTTSSAVAISVGNSVRLIPDAFGREILPSLVVIRKDRQFFVGHDAVTEARKYSGDNLTIGSVKRMMDRQKEFHWGQVRSSPQILTALILAELRVQAEMYLGKEVRQAVIAVPANFGFSQRQFTKEAARIAGLETVRILSEATAAVCSARSKSDVRVIAADLGGGTFDVSVIECGDDVVEVKAAGGDARLGGEDFTDTLANLILKKAANDFDITAARNDPLTLRRIKDIAEDSKLLLSGSASVEVTVPCIKTFRGRLENIVCTISRAEFETECDPFLRRMETTMDQVLREAGLQSHHQAMIWLLGNASRMPAVSEHLRKKYYYPVRTPGLVNMKNSVALGAARIAATLQGLEEHLLLLDVTPCSLGISTRDSNFITMIKKHSTIPARATETFSTVSDNQASVLVRILEEVEKGSHKIIGTLNVDRLPPRKAGVVEIEVAFDVDVNNVLRASAKAKNCNWWGEEGDRVEVKCDGFELPEKTLSQYHLLVQDWIQERRKCWPRTS